jgi:hypothetical protein
MPQIRMHLQHFILSDPEETRKRLGAGPDQSIMYFKSDTLVGYAQSIFFRS